LPWNPLPDGVEYHRENNYVVTTADAEKLSSKGEGGSVWNCYLPEKKLYVITIQILFECSKRGSSIEQVSHPSQIYSREEKISS
jgi:hypothetical protein